MKKVTFGMLAAVDSGKTTLTEAILYTTGQIRTAGRVDHGDSHMDTNAIERERGITIFSKQAGFDYGGMHATILDTPGHVDFAAEMERTLSVIDYAVLIIGANDGIKAHTSTLWKLLQRHRIPVFIFVNKIDLVDQAAGAGGTESNAGMEQSVTRGIAGREGIASPATRARLTGELGKGLGADLLDFTDTESEKFLDDLSLVSDKAAELVLDYIDSSDMSDGSNGRSSCSRGTGDDTRGKGSCSRGTGDDTRGKGSCSRGTGDDTRGKREAIDLEIIRLIKERELFPVYFGSALKFSGVEDFVDGLTRYTAAFRGDEKGEPSGRIFKVAMDGRDRVTFMKVTTGKVKPRQLVRVVPRAEADEYEEKINEIRVYSGDKYTVAEAAEPGEIVAVTGLSAAVPGDVIGRCEPAEGEVLQPYMTYNAYAEHEEDTHALLDALSMLAAEDPKLETEWISGSGQIVVRIMGAVQLEVLARVVKDRFGISCTFGEEKIIYKETVRGTYEGVGHFEPLRHYAEVHLIISPADRGSGITVRSECPLELLDINWQNLVMSVLERHHLRGPLTGSSLTDVDICLVAGRASKKHTEGGDFREAALRALRQGLMQAMENGDMVLLEPWLDFRVETEVPEIGAIMTDIDNMGGTVDLPEISAGGSTAVLTGRAPAAGLRGYGARLAGSAHGRTQFSCAMGGYDVCKAADDVIARVGYAPDRDVRNPADSVFCSHGSADIIKWNEVFNYMHIPSVLEARRKHISILPGSQTDEELAAEARVKEQRRLREQKTATDKELRAIFEQTYGPIRQYRRPKEAAPGAGYAGYDDYEDYGEYDESDGSAQNTDYDSSGAGTDSKSYGGAQQGSRGGDARSGGRGAGAGTSNTSENHGAPSGNRADSANKPSGGAQQGSRGGDARSGGRGFAKVHLKPTVTHLFVDGYNLIHAWPELKELADIDFGSARDELTDIICNYSGFMGCDTTLVYDAYKVTEGVGSKMNVNGIKVVYTREHETADAFIERETLNLMKRIKASGRKAGSSDRIMVVTSDNLEQIVSMGHGALRISSREFIHEIERVNEQIRSMH